MKRKPVFLILFGFLVAVALVIMSIERTLKIEKPEERLSEMFANVADMDPDDSKEKLYKEKLDWDLDLDLDWDLDLDLSLTILVGLSPSQRF